MEISPNISEMESSIGKIKKMESSVGKIKNLMEISRYIYEMKTSIGKIKDGRVLENTKAFYYTEGVKES